MWNRQVKKGRVRGVWRKSQWDVEKIRKEEFKVYGENPSGMLRRYEMERSLFQLKSEVSEGHT